MEISKGLESKLISKTMYAEVIEKIEKMSKLIHFALFKITFVFCQTVPVLMTLMNYFFFDMGNEAFPDVQFM